MYKTLVKKLLSDKLFILSAASLPVVLLVLKILRTPDNGSGIFVVILATLFPIAFLVAIYRLLTAYNQACGKKHRILWILKLILPVTVFGIAFLFLEVFLLVQSKRVTKEATNLAPVAVMPKELERRIVPVPETKLSYYWCGKLHIHDDNFMRRHNGPFPEKKPGTFRIMIVGDSLTYGYGVDESETYSAVLQNKLSKNYNVEVLNLGISGRQSTDICKIIKDFKPKLQPDMIIYGICLNDFLSQGVGEYANNMAYPFPLPAILKDYLAAHTLSGKYLATAYNNILVNLHVRNNFFDDILKDFKNYRTRFAKDLAEMNAYVVTSGSEPVLAMVLDQYPNLDGNGFKIAQIAEDSIKKANMNIIPTLDYYKKYDKKGMNVNQWEGHPNKEAHEIFADMLYGKIISLPYLEKYKISKKE